MLILFLSYAKRIVVSHRMKQTNGRPACTFDRVFAASLRETSVFAGFIGQPLFVGQPMNGLHPSADKTEALIAELWHLKSTDEMQSVVGKKRIACETQSDGIPTEATWPEDQPSIW